MTAIPANHASVHQRINEILENYWGELCAESTMPLESDVNPRDLDEIWDYCFLVSVRDGTFFYNHLGAKLVEAYGDDFSGREITEALLGDHPASLYKKFQYVSVRGKPANDENEFRNAQGNVVKYRACILPLGGRDRIGTAFLLGGMKWKAF